MPIFQVPLFEGNQKKMFQVEAATKEEAFEQAKAYREQRFQESNTREGLAARQEETEAEVIRNNNPRLRGQRLGLAQSGVNIVSGVADMVTGAAEAIADVIPGMEGVGESLKANREDIREFNADAYTMIQERVAGRPMTEPEKAAAEEEADKMLGYSALAAEVGVGMGVGSVVLKASTMPRMLAAGTTEGFMSGFLFSDTKADTKQQRNADRLGQGTLGALLGGGLSIVPGVFAGVKNWMVRAMSKATGDLTEKRALLKELGVEEATLGQLSGDPRILAMEAESAGKVADDMLRKQAQQATEGIARKVGVRLPDMSEVTTGTRKVVQDGLQKVRVVLGSMRRSRNIAFEEGLDALEEATGGLPVIKVHGMVPVANELMAGAVASYRNVKFAKPIQDIFKEINESVAVGGLTPKAANSILLRLEQIKKGGFGVFDMADDVVKQGESTYRGHAQSIANTLKKSLEASFDATAESMGGQAGRQLQNLRSQYGQASNTISGIEKDFMVALGMNGSPDQILRKLGQADAASVRSVMDALESVPGGVGFKNKLGEALFKQAISDGSTGAVGFAQKAGDFNLKAFAESMFKRVEASKLQGILSPEKERAAVKGLQALKLLFNDPRVATQQGVFKTHLALELQNVAINVLSRDPGFAARLVAGTIQKGKGAESLFYTKEGQELLLGAVKSIVHGKQTGAMIGAWPAIMASIWGAGEAEGLVADNVEKASASMGQQQQ